MSKKQKWLREGADIVVKDAFKDAQPGPEQKRPTWSRDPNEVVLKFEFHNATVKTYYGKKAYLRAVVTDEGHTVSAVIDTHHAWDDPYPSRYGSGASTESPEFFKDPLGKRRPDAGEAEAYFDHWFRGKFGEGSK